MPRPKAQPDQFVTYLNERSSRLQSLNYGDVRLVASDHSVPLPALRGSLAASQPRNFRMTGTGGAIGAKVDLGSNADQFWVYFDAPTVKPQFVFASHTDFEAGRAKIPGGIPFEPDWVMQALGMTTFPPTAQYSVKPSEKDRTYTLYWTASTPSGQQVTKEIVFDADTATGTRSQVKQHVVKDLRGKVICVADIKASKAIQPGPGEGAGPQAQYPTHIVLKWVEQKFEMDLTLENAQVNQQPNAEQAKRLFTRPNVTNVPANDLAKYEFK